MAPVIGSFQGVVLGWALTFLSIFLILLILVQRGRGGGLTGALGGPGGQSAFGTKAGDMFTKITSFTALGWIFLCAYTMWLLGAHTPPAEDTQTSSRAGIEAQMSEDAGSGSLDALLSEDADETEEGEATGTLEVMDDPNSASGDDESAADPADEAASEADDAPPADDEAASTDGGATETPDEEEPAEDESPSQPSP